MLRFEQVRWTAPMQLRGLSKRSRHVPVVTVRLLVLRIRIQLYTDPAQLRRQCGCGRWPHVEYADGRCSTIGLAPTCCCSEGINGRTNYAMSWCQQGMYRSQAMLSCVALLPSLSRPPRATSCVGRDREDAVKHISSLSVINCQSTRLQFRARRVPWFNLQSQAAMCYIGTQHIIHSPCRRTCSMHRLWK